MSTPVTGFRLSDEELELLDEGEVCRSSMVRFLIRTGLGSPDGDLFLVADVLTDLAENLDGLSDGQRELLFRTVSVLRGHAERSSDQMVLGSEFSKEGVSGL